MNVEANLHSLLSFAWTLTHPTNFNLLRQNIVFSSYSERMPVSFSWLFHYFSFFLCYFTLLLIFTKIIFRLLFYYIFFSWKLFLFFHVPGCSGMFRDVPECSGMFQNVPCSGFYRRPVVIPDNCREKFIREHGDWTKWHVDEEFGDSLCHDDICH